MDMETYRAQLFQDIYAQDDRLTEAHALLRSAIEAVPNEHDREHVKTHEIRYLQTIALLPDGPGDLVDIGAVPYYGEPLKSLKKWNLHNVEILSIDYEQDPIPFPDASFGAALLCEVIEHFVKDPLFCLIEINRILKPGGCFVVTTPNAASWFSIYQALNQRHPSRWPVYSGDPRKARNHIHAREYTCSELLLLLDAAGFGEFHQLTLDYAIAPPFKPIEGFDPDNRGETIFVSCRKTSRPRARYIAPIYLETELYR
jgi:SAM-dependent methyltransferase